MTIGAALAMTAFGIASANAFTFETPPSAGSEGGGKGGAAGYMDLDTKSVLPPIGESVQGFRYNDTGGSYNAGGLASPPSPRDTIGPSWLYGR
jgi:hypothetical protein